MKKLVVLENGENRLTYDAESGKLFFKNFLNACAEWKIYSVDSSKKRIELSVAAPLSVKNGENYIEVVHRWVEDCGQQWCFQWKIVSSMQGFSLSFNLKLVKSITKEMMIELPWSLNACPEEFYSLFQGAVYGNNKADNILYEKYPPRLKNFNEVGPDGPTWMGDIPRFTKESGYELIQQTTDLTYPVAALLHERSRKGLWLWADTEGYPIINGFMLKKGFREDETVFSIQFPSIRNLRFRTSSTWEESPDRGIVLSQKQSFSANAAFNLCDAINRPHFIAKIARLNVSEELIKQPDPILPFSEAAKIIERKLNQYDWNEESMYYSSQGESRFQTGWVGGSIAAYCMLHSDNKHIKERALQTLQFIVENGISPSGLLYGIYEDGKWYGASEKTDGLDFAGRFVRRIADALFYILIILEKNMIEDKTLKSKCEEAAIKCLDAFSRLSGKYGHFGSHIDFNTGDILWGGSTAGVTAIGCLVKGSILFKKAEWMENAEKAAVFYEKFLFDGHTIGGPGDILMTPDSESAYAILESFWLLFKKTQNERYLNDAVMAAELFATWVYRKDYKLPVNSTLGKLGVNPMGTVMANAQNKHGGPGICSASGKTLLELYEKTGDSFYIDLLSNIKRALPQLICKHPGYIFGVKTGGVSEKINVADSCQNRGEVDKSGHWTEQVVYVSFIEIPSVYIDIHKNVFILDHCLAKLKGSTLEILNPTDYQGDFRVYFKGNIKVISLQPLESKSIEINEI